MRNPTKTNESHTDRDALGNAPDLSRSEPRSARDVTGPSDAVGVESPKVLIMGRPPRYAVPLEEAFRRAGWTVTACPGPGRVACPLLSGQGACSARCSSDVTVAYVDGSASHAGAVSMVKLRCAVDPVSPAIVALESRMDPPTTSGATTIMGAVRPPEHIVTEATRIAHP